MAAQRFSVRRQHTHSRCFAGRQARRPVGRHERSQACMLCPAAGLPAETSPPCWVVCWAPPDTAEAEEEAGAEVAKAVLELTACMVEERRNKQAREVWWHVGQHGASASSRPGAHKKR